MATAPDVALDETAAATATLIKLPSSLALTLIELCAVTSALSLI